MAHKRNLLGEGLTLALRHWPAIVWTYVFNLGLALLFSLPLHSQISAITAHSLAAQRLMGAFDLGVLAGVIAKLSQGPGPDLMTSYFATPVFFVLYFLLVPGVLVCYQTGAPARLSTMLLSGFAHFWRFVRLTLVTVIIGGIVMGGVLTLQNLWTAHLDENMTGRKSFLLQMAGLTVAGLVAAMLRVYFDLMQVYTVQLGMLGPEAGTKRSRQIRRTFKPAWRALWHNFFSTYGMFVLLAVLGLAAVFATARVAMHSLAQPRVWPMFLLAQIGLLMMMFTRFWQRGAETILALDNPIPLPPVPEALYQDDGSGSDTPDPDEPCPDDGVVVEEIVIIAESDPAPPPPPGQGENTGSGGSW